MIYTVGHVVGLQALLVAAAELEMGIVKYMTNYLNSIVSYKFGNLCIYCNYCKLCNYHKLHNCHNKRQYKLYNQFDHDNQL